MNGGEGDADRARWLFWEDRFSWKTSLELWKLIAVNVSFSASSLLDLPPEELILTRLLALLQVTGLCCAFSFCRPNFDSALTRLDD